MTEKAASHLIVAIDGPAGAGKSTVAARLAERLQAGDRETARFVGLPLDQFTAQPLGPVDQATRDFVAPLVERAALTMVLNEAWLLFGAAVLASLLMVPLLRRRPPAI